MYIYKYTKSKYQPGKVANPASGQLNMENEYLPLQFAPENVVSRDDFGSSVPHEPAHLHTHAKYGAYLRDSSRVPRRRPFLYLYPHASSGQSRVIGSRNYVPMAFTAESPPA